MDGDAMTTSESKGRESKTHPARETKAHEGRTHEAPAREAKAHEGRTHEAPAREAKAHEGPAREAKAHEDRAHAAPAHESKAHEDRAHAAPAHESKAHERTLVDHALIRRWAESRGARPSCVKGTEASDGSCMLRLDFPGYSGEHTLQPIEWERWFRVFDQRQLALIVEDKMADGTPSNFNKLVRRETPQHH
jgi:hypothetical protein